jgi:nucleoside-diphosphate-sugar epimerase
MTTPSPTVLLLGATGRTGRRVLDHLTQRGVRVRALVRDAARLSAELRERPGVEVVEAGPLDLDDAAFAAHVAAADVVISCLGHTLSLRGIFGAPRDLVTRVVRRVCAVPRPDAATRPLRVVWMTSVSVNGPRAVDARRGVFERGFLRVLCAVLPPARDNQTAADALANAPAGIEWVVVRPDALLDGPTGTYTVHPGLVDSLFSPGKTTMNNIGHFMAALVTEPDLWSAWRGRLPVIVDAPT